MFRVLALVAVLATGLLVHTEPAAARDRWHGGWGNHYADDRGWSRSDRYRWSDDRGGGWRGDRGFRRDSWDRGYRDRGYDRRYSRPQWGYDNYGGRHLRFRNGY